MFFGSPELLFWFLQYSNFRTKLEVKNGIIVTSWNRLHILPVTYPEQCSYWYTDMGAQILAPKKWNIPLFTLLFFIADYASSFQT